MNEAGERTPAGGATFKMWGEMQGCSSQGSPLRAGTWVTQLALNHPLNQSKLTGSLRLEWSHFLGLSSVSCLWWITICSYPTMYLLWEQVFKNIRHHYGRRAERLSEPWRRQWMTKRKQEHVWTHSSSDQMHKTWKNSSQTKILVWRGEHHAPPLALSNW